MSTGGESASGRVPARLQRGAALGMKAVATLRRKHRGCLPSQAYLVLLQVRAQAIGQRLLLDKERVGQLFCLLQQPVEQRLQLCGGRIVRQVQLRACGGWPGK